MKDQGQEGEKKKKKKKGEWYRQIWALVPMLSREQVQVLDASKCRKERGCFAFVSPFGAQSLNLFL